MASEGLAKRSATTKLVLNCFKYYTTKITYHDHNHNNHHHHYYYYYYCTECTLVYGITIRAKALSTVIFLAKAPNR